MTKKAPTGYWSLCPSEPFRVFFPMGLLIGISGVSLWPLYFTGIHKFYPGVMHGRMMIQGFLTAFIIGFLGTAFPRLSGAAPFTAGEMWSLIILLSAVTGVQIGMQPFVADCLFLLLLLVFSTFLAKRYRDRTELPPPSFVLVLMGLASAAVGTGALIAAVRLPNAMAVAFLGNSLLYQAFVLCLLMGVGGFLLPRFLGLEEPKDNGENVPVQWLKQAVIAGMAGMLVIITFAAEAWSGNLRTWGIVRALLVVVYLLSHVPLLSSQVSRTTLAQSLRAGFVLLLAGLFLPALWPAQRIAGLHLVFVGGYTVITLCVATRVVLGHSGQGRRVQQRLPFLLGTMLLLLIGAVLRVWGDFLPLARPAMLNMASYLWMLAAVIWGWRLLPAVRIPDSES